MIPKHRKPVHPGVLIQDTLNDLGMTQVTLAKRLKIPIQRLNEIIRGRRGISADTALRLSKVLGTTPEYWMQLQIAIDLYVARHTFGQWFFNHSSTS
jgi:addiction module HigA family antidote